MTKQKKYVFIAINKDMFKKQKQNLYGKKY